MGSWDWIATHIHGRTGRQCRDRWRVILDQGEQLKRGKWSVEEDEHLQKLYAEHGSKNWSWIATQIWGRNRMQCKNRWHSREQRVDLKTKSVKWSADEDEQIKELVAEHGNESWAWIATHIRGRSGTQCRQRWARYL